MASRLALITVATAATLAVFASSALAGARPYDFNGDGRQELAVGMPSWDNPGAPSSGAVLGVRTTTAGLKASAQLITQATPGIPGDPQSGSTFGSNVASGDFDNDGFADLVIAPASRSTGLVIVYGSADGLNPSRSTRFRESGASYDAVAAGDVNGDGFSDLAVSVAQFAGGSFQDRVAIIRGSRGGLRTTRSATLNVHAVFLRLSDLDRDRHPELVFDAVNFVGACRGTAAGPSTCTQIPANEGNSADVATGDITGNGDREIVLGRPDLGKAGSLLVYNLTSEGVRFRFRITQSTRGVPGHNQSDDRFGAAVDIGRIGRKGKGTLAVGAPGEDFNQGRVTLIRGARKRVARRGNSSFELNSRRIPGSSSTTSQFGTALTLLDHNGDRRLDLTIGAPSGDDHREGSGRVVSLLGAKRGLTRKRAKGFGLAKLGFSPEGFEFGRILGRR